MPGASLDQPRHRLERELEALLVDEPADQQHELLVGRGELGAQPARARRRPGGCRSSGSIPFGITVDPLLVDAEDVGDLLAHVVRAGDHAVGAVRDPALDAVDVGLRVLVDPALVAAVLGRVDRRHQRRAEAAGEVVAGDRRRASRGRGRGRSRSGRRARRRRRACRSSCARPRRRTRRGRAGRFGSRTRWMWTPADDLLRGRLLAAAGEHVDLDAARRPAPRRACARGGRGRPRSAAGTPRRGSGRGSSGFRARAAARGSGRVRGCACAGRCGPPESMASSIASGVIGRPREG